MMTRDFVDFSRTQVPARSAEPSGEIMNIILSKELAGTYDTHASFVLRDLDAPGDDRLDVYPGSGNDLFGAQQWATADLAERGITVTGWTGHIRDSNGRLFEQPHWTPEEATSDEHGQQKAAR